MEELRQFSAMDNHEAVESGDWEKTLGPLPVVKPKCTADFLEVVVREGADELTLRCAASSTPRMWERADEGQPLVDEDWHAVYEGVRD